MQYEIIKPRTADIKEIDELFEKTIKDNFKAEGINDPFDKMANEEIENLKNNFRLYFDPNNIEEHYLVASSANQIIGIIAYGKANNLITENLKIDYTNIPEVKSVYVLPNHQNRGVGRALFRSILSALKDHNIKQFCLDSGYKRAQVYWAKLLGDPQCVLNDYWQKGSHHMIWYKELQDTMNSF